jgi:hypothetical protein
MGAQSFVAVVAEDIVMWAFELVRPCWACWAPAAR